MKRFNYSVVAEDFEKSGEVHAESHYEVVQKIFQMLEGREYEKVDITIQENE